MNLAGMPTLALVLFAPWFLVLGALFWIYPRQPTGAGRRWFDVAALVGALALFLLTLHWAHDIADRGYGRMWPQVLATSVGYGVYLGAMAAAWLVRRRWILGPRRGRAGDGR